MSSEVVARPAGYTGDEPPAPQPTAAGPARGVPGPIRRNGLFLLVLVLGIALRALTQLAYQPALLYVDSFRYLARVQILNPAQLDPLGYSVVLRPLLAIGGLGTVTLVQHVVGLLIGVLIYVLACRYGARRWLAGLAAAPILLDGYQLQIEQNIMADVWMELFLV
ncbi:MAG: glycosyltransferase family 2 protein, partial [Sciscionella sp.]|nr:glycosyltransferase family 2 protein [Sciscionella sp.]